MDSRQAAFDILIRIERDKAYSNIALDSRLGNQNSGRDSAFATALVYGVLERKITLDYFISVYYSGPIKRLKPNVLTILRMGIYQLYYMDKIPVQAAVNESVKLAKRNGAQYASGLVNGILRSASVNNKDIPDMKNKEEYYSIKYSCPGQLVNHFIKSYGLDNALLYLENSLNRPPLTIRVNTLYTDTDMLIKRLEEENVKAERIDEIDNALELFGSGSVEKLGVYNEGLFHVQDISSQICCKLMDAQPGDTVLDMCSAPGGKSLTIAQYMKNQGSIYSYDLYKNRVSLIRNSAQRLGINIIKVDCNDASVYNSNIPVADKVLCDVPCSGLGVIRRKPEIKYKSFEEINDLPHLQLKILENGARYVKTGGKLLYSTCTLNHRENEDVIEYFLHENEEYELKSMKTFLGKDYRGDGFFTAEIIKLR